MLRRLFGENEEEQLLYLQNRVILTGIALVVYAIGVILTLIGGDSKSFIATLGGLMMGVGSFALTLFVLFMWGWSAVKAALGITSIGALLGRNVVLGSAIFVVSICLAWIFGLVVVFLGCGRYIFLRVKQWKGEN